ncbi:MAG: ABC transporter ATP-binding protein [Rubellimicrobium sp.]|nr:ABC transporter ATP-binding protein [Rubellimicrobium sp.]
MLDRHDEQGHDNAPPAISFRDVVKIYGAGAAAFTALHGADLDIRDNEFFTLLGPSGSGKTTLLRLLAGFEVLTSGTIHLFGAEIRDLPPERRPVNTVFQHYALFPHLSVAENVAFGLKRLRRPAAEIRSRVAEMLALVHMEHLADRQPGQLSGGQQQRVALARALAPEPKVLLLDEPLSALDLKLRQAMREELQRLQRETGITFVFVTHDQDEALSMSDRIAVLSEGRIQQIGTPDDLYNRPYNRFVADFIGDTNLLEARVLRRSGDEVNLRLSGGVEVTAAAAPGIGEGAQVTVSVRPENVVLTGAEAGSVRARLVGKTFLGASSLLTLALDDASRVTVRRDNRMGHPEDPETGAEVGIVFAPGSLRVLLP